VALLGSALCACDGQPSGPTVSVDDPFLDTLQARTFAYFWELANPANGLVPDRAPTPSFASVAAVGFGLTAYPIGVERGYISRGEARGRVLTTLRFLWEAPQGAEAAGTTGYRGFYYHFLDMGSGARFEQVELSTIDTALLLAGVLACREYFDGDHIEETAIRELADSIYGRVDWRWAQREPPGVAMAWRPESGFSSSDWRGYNEAMILYVLALGSPTHPIEPAVWDFWVSTYRWGEFYGYEHVGFEPLFGHQYSHAWIDFRGIRDAYMRGRGIDYFENSRRAAYAQRAYAVDNPAGWRGYGADIWGLTACDGPFDGTLEIGGIERRFFTYRARGASFTRVEDDGTIAPTAAGGSIPFAPGITIPALKRMRDLYGEYLFGDFGFLDAFNPTLTREVALRHGRVIPDVGWFDTDYLGIDQGPILIMTENYRSELIWELMKKNASVVRGLRRAGFSGGWLDEVAP
jgi:hypothetical protein